MRIVLFDIDGTILKSGGVGRVAMEAALEQFRLIAEDALTTAPDQEAA